MPKQSRVITFIGIALVVVAAALSLVAGESHPDPAEASSLPAGALDAAETGRGKSSKSKPDGALGPGPGYWLAGADGGVFAYGRAHFAGGAAGKAVSPIAGIAATPAGRGYWLAGRDGAVFGFGEAKFLGGVNGKVNSPVVAIVGTPSGKGYWLAGADGGMFAFGDARFYGALAGKPLNQPIVAMAATPTGDGYWLVAKDGGVFAFGDASFQGGTAGLKLNRGIVSITPTLSGRGYWLTGADGGVFGYGDAGYHGSAIGVNPSAPIIGLARTKSGKGYWLAGADGGVFAYGDAGYYGAPIEDGVRTRITALAAGSGTDVRHHPQTLAGTFGWDISWPQCHMLDRLPNGGYAFAIIGVNDGHQFSENKCLKEEYNWALRHGSVASLYVNVNWPSRADEPRMFELTGGVCAPGPDQLPCMATEWGRRGALDSIAIAKRNHVSAPMWWLDVETMNRWSADQGLNALVVAGAKAVYEEHGIRVGIYSTGYQFRLITGDYQPRVPTWVAGPQSAAEAPAACRMEKSFGGGVPWLVQFPNGLDGNILCEPGAKELLRAFRLPPPPAVPEY